MLCTPIDDGAHVSCVIELYGVLAKWVRLKMTSPSEDLTPAVAYYVTACQHGQTRPVALPGFGSYASSLGRTWRLLAAWRT